MQFFKYFLITIVVIALLDPTEGWWFDKELKKLGKGIENTVKTTVKNIKKTSCRFLFGVGCTAAVDALGKALGAGSSGLESGIVAIGVSVGTNACHMRKESCKRSVDMTEILLPFSDEMSDYDKDGDKLITYEEFVFAVLRSVNLADPTELREPFAFSDFNENGVLDVDEFNGAPLLFAHAPFGSRKLAQPHINKTYRK